MKFTYFLNFIKFVYLTIPVIIIYDEKSEELYNEEIKYYPSVLKFKEAVELFLKILRWYDERRDIKIIEVKKIAEDSKLEELIINNPDYFLVRIFFEINEDEDIAKIKREELFFGFNYNLIISIQALLIFIDELLRICN